MKSSFEEAVRVCVEDVCRLIGDGPKNPGPPMQLKEWECGPDGHFRPRYTNHSMLLFGELDKLPSFRACANCAKADPVIGPQIDQLVGTSLSKFRLSLDQIVRSLVGPMVSEEGQAKFDERLFLEHWEYISGDLTATEFLHSTIAPLPNIVAPFPVNVTPNIVIDKLTSEEVNRCAQVGIL